MEKKIGAFYQALIKYNESNMYPMHMPGHKRKILEEDLLEQIKKIDITEIPDFDDQYENTGYLKAVQDEAARLFHASNSRLLVNGSTGGILAAISACMNYGDSILIARNSHKSAYNAMMINGLKSIYIYPEISNNTHLTLGIRPDDIQKALEENKEIQAVYITSPTYEGVISDIKSIANIVHAKGIPLIVDEAHGPHLGMDELLAKEYGMVSAITQGADIVIQSLHKTLPAFTQCAIIHYQEGYIDIERLERYLMVYQTSSPSYILLAGMERCIDMISENQKELFDHYREYLKWFYLEASKLSVIRILNGKESGYGFDLGKINIYLPRKGKWLANLLREQYAIELEMSTRDYCLAMTSIMDSKEGYERLLNALFEIDTMLFKQKNIILQTNDPDIPHPKAIMSIAQATRKINRQYNQKSIHDYLLGDLSTHLVYAYPPGIPIIAPGEVFDEEVIAYIESLESNGIEIKMS